MTADEYMNAELSKWESMWEGGHLAALYAVSGRKKEAEAAVRAAEQAGYRVHPQLKEDIRRMST